MEINNKLEDEFLVYEDTEQGILVAINKKDQVSMKKYWKSKDKSSLEQMINGFPFIQSEEQETLKIDFSEEKQFEIKNLKKFS